jgi:hypothetical protein
MRESDSEGAEVKGGSRPYISGKVTSELGVGGIELVELSFIKVVQPRCKKLEGSCISIFRKPTGTYKGSVLTVCEACKSQNGIVGQKRKKDYDINGGIAKVAWGLVT